VSRERPAPPVLALTAGDPAGIGPEILLKTLVPRLAGGATAVEADWLPLAIGERVAFAPLEPAFPDFPWDRLVVLTAPPSRAEVARLAGEGVVPLLDPVGAARTVVPGRPDAADAAGALAALDAGIELARGGAVDALVTCPVSKVAIARHALPGFTGHTDYLAQACGLERYGRDYLMAFLSPDLRVALLTTHLPLAAAVAAVRRQAIEEALACLHRHAPGRIAVAGLNPHAGEDGLLGAEDGREIAPAVAAARAAGIDAHGPESADSLFARARRGEFDWVLALYHDQGLIAVKTAAFGLATNWTLGLPFLRTSVDHGTAYAIAGKGHADAEPLARVVETTLELIRSGVGRAL
jgi:4-hydroxythreonine-4-phosphate dehydrogenase